MSTVADKVKKIVVDQLGVSEDQVTPEAKFIEDLGADSIDIVEFIMAVEEEFGLGETEESALEGIKTVGDVAEYVKDRQ